jgi:DNA polymerase III delta prime subunit
VFALLMVGPPGAGKTSVLEALSDALVIEDVRHALIETEALTSAHPALNGEQWVQPIAAVCALYRRFGYRLLLVAVTVETAADLRGVVEAVGADEHVVVRLEAEPATLRRRVIEREPSGWSGLDDLVGATTRMAPLIAGLDGVALTLSTEGQRPEAVAERIRAAFPGPLRTAGR